MAALGHTSMPFCFVIRQLLGFFPGQVHLSEVPFDDIYPDLPRSSWLSLVTSQFPVCCLTSCSRVVHSQDVSQPPEPSFFKLYLPVSLSQFSFWCLHFWPLSLHSAISWIHLYCPYLSSVRPNIYQISSLLSKVEMVAADTTSSGNLFQWSTILWLKECFLNSSLELFLYSLRLCPLNSVVVAFWNNWCQLIFCLPVRILCFNKIRS